MRPPARNRSPEPIAALQRWLAALIAAGVAVQFLLAGAGAFGATSFEAHTGLGWAIAVVSLLAVAIAPLARRAVGASGNRATSRSRPTPEGSPST